MHSALKSKVFVSTLIFVLFAILAAAVFSNSGFDWRSNSASRSTPAQTHPESLAISEGGSVSGQSTLTKTEAPTTSHQTPDAPLTDFQAIKSLAEAGDPGAQRRLSEMYEYCMLYNFDPEGQTATLLQYAEIRQKSNPRQSKAGMQRLIRRLETLCPGVDNGQPTPSEAYRLWMAEAARNGDLTAEIKLATRSLEVMPKLAFDGMVRKVLDKSDPDAVFALADLLGNRFEASSLIPSSLAGAAADVTSWQIAACRQGAGSCRAGSFTMDGLCMGGGPCNYQSYEEYAFQELVPPADRARMDERINEIIQFLQDQKH
ncbi:MAG: hypothetical protein AB7T07_15655 [Steroidobacteraceae bacterium]